MGNARSTRYPVLRYYLSPLSALALLGVLAAPMVVSAQTPTPPERPEDPVAARTVNLPPEVMGLTSLSAPPASELRDVVERYAADRSALGRRWNVSYSAARRERFRAFSEKWQERSA